MNQFKLLAIGMCFSLTSAVAVSLAEQGPAKPTQSQPLDATGMLKKAGESVVHVTVKLDEKHAMSSGTGFIVSSSGYVITNFHVIEGGSAAFITLPGEKDEIPTELLAVKPELDLALLRLPASIGGIPRKYPALHLHDAGIAEGMDVWALGYPDPGYSVTKGIVTGIRSWNDLTKIRGITQNYSPESHWLQTDCTVNPGNSGGPLVNASGQVIGINTWRFETEKVRNAYFALHAKHAMELVSNVGSTPIDFAKAAKAAEGKRLPQSVFPRLDVVPVGNLADLKSAIGTLRKASVCQSCDGEGEGKKAFTKTTGGIIKTDRTVTKVVQCTKCKGERLNFGPVVYRVFSRLAMASATTSAIDSQTRKQVPLLVKEVAALAFPSLTSAIQSGAKTVLGTPGLRRGAPVVIVGSVVDDFLTQDGESSRIKVIKEARSGQLFIIADTDMLSASLRDVVIAGGLWAGNYYLDNGTPIGVIQGGFMVDVSDEAKAKPEAEMVEAGKPDWRMVYDLQLIETTLRVEENGRFREVTITATDRVLFTCNFRNTSSAPYQYAFDVNVNKRGIGNVALGRRTYSTPVLKPGEVFSFELEVPVSSTRGLGDAVLVNVRATPGN